MENRRFLLYILVVALGFTILTAIKMALPHPEPHEPVDIIGIHMYRPIFFGSADEIAPSSVRNDTEIATTEDASAAQPMERGGIYDRSSLLPSDHLSDQEYFDQMIRDYHDNVLSQNPYRPDVVVRYYKHRQDGEKAQILTDYGFYLHVRPLRSQSEFETLRSNVIYYGSDFPERDLQLITYLLIQNGIEIKEIRRFQDFHGWKRKSIEIGSSVLLMDDPALSLRQIRALTTP